MQTKLSKLPLALLGDTAEKAIMYVFKGAHLFGKPPTFAAPLFFPCRDLADGDSSSSCSPVFNHILWWITRFTQKLPYCFFIRVPFQPLSNPKYTKLGIPCAVLDGASRFLDIKPGVKLLHCNQAGR
jgi:hypothetical protein